MPVPQIRGAPRFVRFEELGDDGHAIGWIAPPPAAEMAGGHQRLVAPRHGAQAAGTVKTKGCQDRAPVADAGRQPADRGITTAEVNRYPVETHSILSRLTPKCSSCAAARRLSDALSRIAMNVPT